MEAKGVRQRRSKKMEDVVESVRPGGSRQRILDWRVFEEYPGVLANEAYLFVL